MTLSKTLMPDEIKHFHESGYLSIPQITTAEEINWMLGIYDRLFDQRAGWENGDFFDFAGTDTPGRAATSPQLIEPSRYEPALKNTQFRVHAHEIAKQLLGPTAELVFEHAMLKPANTGGQTPWHQDEAFFPKYTNYECITFWMPLQPVNATNGCLDFIPASHKGELLSHHRINNDARIHGLEAEGVDESNKVACPLDAGGATIHHSRTLHHAGPNKTDGPRRAYALGYGVRSKELTLRKDFPWNETRSTARDKRANDALSVMQRYVLRMKSTAKAILR